MLRLRSVRPSAIAITIALVLAALAFGTARTARAGKGPNHRALAETLMKTAEAEDEAFDFARALAHYDQGRALDPGSPRAPRAEARAATLRSHAEGDFVPFTKLERVRRDPALSSSPEAIDALVRDAETFPPGLVRVEVWVLAAEALAHRLGRPAEADALLRRVVTDPVTDDVVARKAARDLVALQLARDDLAAADAAVRLAGGRADPQLRQSVSRAMRRRHLHTASISLLALVLLLAARAIVVATRRGALSPVRGALARTWRLALGYAAYVAIAGAALASGYEAGTTRPFLTFGAVLLPIVLVARAWAAAGRATVAARSARAALCGIAVVGAGFLVLEWVDIAFLEGMGL